MPVVPLTLTISLTLVFTFVVFFLREHARGRVSSPERDSLLPLGEETPRLAHAQMPVRQSHAAAAHDDDHACGCHDGSREPCAGCRRRG